MWERNLFNPDLGYAMRLVRTGNATVEQAAEMCGVPVENFHEMLAAAMGCPQPRLQEVEPERKRRRLP